MAAARDQAARIVRSEQDASDNAGSADIADTIRNQPSDESARRAQESGERAPVAKPAIREAVAAQPAKANRRKAVFFGAVALLAVASGAYGAHWFLVGRFHVSTDDAYVRANNTTLGARVSGHIAAIVPRDNALVHAGDVVFKIDDGDYKIAVDAPRSTPSRRRSSGLAAKSPRRRARPSRPRRNSPPRKPA
jgi:membrane fusion protein, multidrug efflux system